MFVSNAKKKKTIRKKKQCKKMDISTTPPSATQKNILYFFTQNYSRSISRDNRNDGAIGNWSSGYPSLGHSLTVFPGNSLIFLTLSDWCQVPCKWRSFLFTSFFFFTATLLLEALSPALCPTTYCHHPVHSVWSGLPWPQSQTHLNLIILSISSRT